MNLRADGKPAVLLLSGGLDSTTLLALATTEGYAVNALTFRYGQRHEVEIERARPSPRDTAWRGMSSPTSTCARSADRRSRATSPSRRTAARTSAAAGIPVTYVPARNTIFLSFALAWAEVLGANDIFIGVNALDYSGYPDCRPEYIRAFETMANLATKAGSRAPRASPCARRSST